MAEYVWVLEPWSNVLNFLERARTVQNLLDLSRTYPRIPYPSCQLTENMMLLLLPKPKQVCCVDVCSSCIQLGKSDHAEYALPGPPHYTLQKC